jgi:hypothetical protein
MKERRDYRVDRKEEVECCCAVLEMKERRDYREE